MIAAAQLWRTLALCAALAPAVWSAEPTAETPATRPNPRYTGSLPRQEWKAEDFPNTGRAFSLTQAPDTGFIYLGTNTGVLEYDGARWRLLAKPNPRSAFVVRGLATDRQGGLWAGADNQIVRYRPDSHGQWQAESMIDRLPIAERTPGIVWRIQADPRSGSIWATSATRIYCFSSDGTAARSWPTPNNLILSEFIDGEPWFCERSERLFRVRGETLERAPVPPLPEVVQMFLGLSGTPEGTLQVAHSRGIVELKNGAWASVSDELTQLLRGADQAASVARLPDGKRIFIGTSGCLIWVDPAGQVLGRHAPPESWPSPNANLRTTLDRDGGLWIAGTDLVHRVQIDSALTRHGPEQGLIGGVRRAKEESGTLWLAGAQGFFSRDPLTGRFTKRTALADEFSLLPGPVGGWVIASSVGLREWNDRGELSLPTTGNGGASLVQDLRDPARIFAGTENQVRVFRRETTKWVQETALTGMPVTVYSLGMDRNNVLWVAGAIGQGIWRAVAPDGNWVRAKVERVDGTGGLPEAVWVVSIIEGEAVIHGTKGLWRSDPTGTHFTPDQRFSGLPTGATTPMFRVRAGNTTGVIYLSGDLDHVGRYWRGTRASPDAPWHFAELPLGEAKNQAQLQDITESADLKTLWLAGKMLLSHDLTAPPPPPFAAPTARWREVRPLDGTEKFYGGASAVSALHLPLSQRAVHVEFSSASLRVHAGGKTGIEYRTRVAGVDRIWTSWSKETARELTNLPPGEVKLEVQARNHLNAAGPVANLTLIVPPFWWETWWLRALVILTGAAVVAAAVAWLVRRQYRQRIALLEAQAALQSERERIARDMHDDLGSSLASLVHLSSATAEKPDASMLARIHEASQDLVHRTRDIVWAATPGHDSLESLIEQIAAHAERTLADRGMQVTAELPPKVPAETIGATARHGVFLAFKEAVNNTAKYSQARHATVRISLPEDALVVTFIDDGTGFAADEIKGTGHGLGNISSRLAALGGSTEITSRIGHGTTVVLRLPRGRRNR